MKKYLLFLTVFLPSVAWAQIADLPAGFRRAVGRALQVVGAGEGAERF